MRSGNWCFLRATQQAADTVWNALKDKAVKLVANVISASPTKLTLAGSADDIDDKKADITLTMAKPLPAKSFLRSAR